MSERVFFVFLVPSVNIKSNHMDYNFDNVIVSTRLQEIVDEAIKLEGIDVEPNRELSSVSYVRLMLVQHQPEVIQYDYKARVPFDEIISSEFVMQHIALLQNGSLLKIERHRRNYQRQKTDEHVSFTLYIVKEQYRKRTRCANIKTEICCQTSTLMSLFIQQCQLISKRHELLPYVIAWQKNTLVDKTGFTGGYNYPNIRLSCCFNHVTVTFDKRSLVCKLGVLRHHCAHRNDENVRFLVRQEVLMWYGYAYNS